MGIFVFVILLLLAIDFAMYYPLHAKNSSIKILRKLFSVYHIITHIITQLIKLTAKVVVGYTKIASIVIPMHFINKVDKLLITHFPLKNSLPKNSSGFFKKIISTLGKCQLVFMPLTLYMVSTLVNSHILNTAMVVFVIFLSRAIMPRYRVDQLIYLN